MIEAGLVEHLVKFLDENYSSISSYGLEYTTALFMNLSLHNETRLRCKVMAEKIIRLFPKLLDDKYECCFPYVNGAMYSLLTDPTINEQAKKMNLDKVLKQQINVSNSKTN